MLIRSPLIVFWGILLLSCCAIRKERGRELELSKMAQETSSADQSHLHLVEKINSEVAIDTLRIFEFTVILKSQSSNAQGFVEVVSTGHADYLELSVCPLEGGLTPCYLEKLVVNQTYLKDLIPGLYELSISACIDQEGGKSKCGPKQFAKWQQRSSRNKKVDFEENKVDQLNELIVEAQRLFANAAIEISTCTQLSKEEQNAAKQSAESQLQIQLFNLKNMSEELTKSSIAEAIEMLRDDEKGVGSVASTLNSSVVLSEEPANNRLKGLSLTEDTNNQASLISQDQLLYLEGSIPYEFTLGSEACKDGFLSLARNYLNRHDLPYTTKALTVQRLLVTALFFEDEPCAQELHLNDFETSCPAYRGFQEQVAALRKRIYLLEAE